MNKSEIWEVLECCLLASDEADINYLIEKGFEPELAKIGVRLYHYLKSKQINIREVTKL
jgi:hypothetical protein